MTRSPRPSRAARRRDPGKNVEGAKGGGKGEGEGKGKRRVTAFRPAETSGTRCVRVQFKAAEPRGPRRRGAGARDEWPRQPGAARREPPLAEGTTAPCDTTGMHIGPSGRGGRAQARPYVGPAAPPLCRKQECTACALVIHAER